MIVSAQDGSHWASSPESFVLREYKATIVQEDGTDKEETVNEASNVVSFILKEIATMLKVSSIMVSLLVAMYFVL